MPRPLALMLIPTLLLAVMPAAVPASGQGGGGSTEGMVLVPGGPFTMGRDAPEDARIPPYESPAHPVTLKPFYIGRTEVTNGEYEAFVTAKGYEKRECWSDDGWAWLEAQTKVLPGEEGKTIRVRRSAPDGWEARRKTLGDDFARHPVTGVSWYEAEAYARFAGKRLPTEAEWERAARGLDDRLYPWGDDFEVGLAESSEGDGGSTRPVGTNPADVSPADCLDMGGNVSEWTATEFGPYPGTKATSRYWGKDAMRKLKIARGGSWRVIDMGQRPNEYKCRVSYRGKDYWPDKGYSFYGFRLAMDVPESKK